MKLAGVLPCSLVNGKGVRYVVFVQGCGHACPGCHNPETWDFDGGYDLPVEELAADIRIRRLIDGITLSGGDPFYQQEECVELLRLLPGMNVWVYTGYRYEEIKDTELARMAHVIVDGPYIEALRCEEPYRGSSNQRIIWREKHAETQYIRSTHERPEGDRGADRQR